MSHKVLLEDDLAKAVLRRAAPAVRTRLKRAMAELAKDPHATNPAADIRRLETDPAKEPVYRLRVGAWRLIYTIDGANVRVVRVMHREEGYEWLD